MAKSLGETTPWRVECQAQTCDFIGNREAQPGAIERRGYAEVLEASKHVPPDAIAAFAGMQGGGTGATQFTQLSRLERRYVWLSSS